MGGLEEGEAEEVGVGVVFLHVCWAWLGAGCLGGFGTGRYFVSIGIGIVIGLVSRIGDRDRKE